MTAAEQIAAGVAVANRIKASGFWRDMSARDVALWQLNQPRLCMPFETFHNALEEALGRGVRVEEMRDKDMLRAEILGTFPSIYIDRGDRIRHDRRQPDNRNTRACIGALFDCVRDLVRELKADMETLERSSKPYCELENPDAG